MTFHSIDHFSYEELGVVPLDPLFPERDAKSSNQLNLSATKVVGLTKEEIPKTSMPSRSGRSWTLDEQVKMIWHLKNIGHYSEKAHVWEAVAIEIGRTTCACEQQLRLIKKRKLLPSIVSHSLTGLYHITMTQEEMANFDPFNNPYPDAENKVSTRNSRYQVKIVPNPHQSKRWSSAEDTSLEELVQKHQKNWQAIADELGTGRTATACSVRWSLKHRSFRRL